MQQLISLLDQQTVFAFLLLFARVLSFFVFMPIFGDKTLPFRIKIALAFYFSVFLFPLVDIHQNFIDQKLFILSILAEITLGAVSALLVQIVFSAIQIVGDLVGYASALSMANMFDPTTGTQQGIVSRFLYMIVLVMYFETGMYEVTITMLYHSFGMISLGTFDIFSYNGIAMITKEITNMFAFAFSFAFPLFFIGFIMDVYYGYGTKSMPSFSPFIVTFQIKFTLIFLFMMLGLSTFADLFTSYFINKFS